MSELLNCPFCGGEPEMDAAQGYTNFFTGRTETAIAVFCRDCGVQAMVCRGDVPDVQTEDVIAIWNRRATPSPWRPDREEIMVAIAKTWHTNGGWDAFQTGMANMVGLMADAILALGSPEPPQPPSGGVELEALKRAAMEWVEIDNLTSPPCTAEMLKASDRTLFKAVRNFAISEGYKTP